MLTIVLSACARQEAAPPPALETLDLAETLARQGMEDWPPETLLLDWIPTVWAFGLHRLWLATGDASYRDYVQTWLDDGLADFSADEVTSSDSRSPAILAATLMGEGAGDYGLLTDAADAYLAGAPRVDEEAIVHWGPDNPWGMPSDQV